MPRQLPWKSGGGGSRTQTIKPSIRPRTKPNIPDDIDDNLFDHTALAGNSKGKGKAKAIPDSDDSQPEPTKARPKRSDSTSPTPRAASSSPPPLAEDAPPNESMRKGLSKFDLRDDEWMMVEDEFLETAKLFTRHLHIAEYDRLKEVIEAKKREAEITRPVVAGAKRSAEGAMKERAKAQDSRQKKAIRDVFASLESESEEEGTTYRAKLSKASLTSKPVSAISGSQDTDSDDLDAPRPTKSKAAAPVSATVTRPRFVPPQAPATPSFATPILPAPVASTKVRTRTLRKTPFDMLDEDFTAPPTATPRGNPRPQSTTGISSPQASQIAKTIKPRRSVDMLNDWGSSNTGGGVSQEVADRIAKRKAVRAREGDGKEKRKATQLDDIPTFLF